MDYRNEFIKILYNIPFLSALIAWVIAQGVKPFIYYSISKKLDWSRALGSGGMPSSHSASMMAVTTAIGMVDGFHSSIFALSLVVTTVVMYDAAGVRRAAGDHAKVLNELIDIVFLGKSQVTDDKLKEWLGHTPFEVGMGALLGVIIGFLVPSIIIGLV